MDGTNLLAGGALSATAACRQIGRTVSRQVLKEHDLDAKRGMKMVLRNALVMALLLSSSLSAFAAGRARSLPPDTLVRVRVLSTLSSKTSHVGDRFPYVVVENVVYKGRTWIRNGTRGKGFLTKVKRAGRFGQNGQLVAAFGQIQTVTGQPVVLTISRKAGQFNDQQRLAAGASFLGLVALGPIGLAGGAFIKGEDTTIRYGSELYVATEEIVY